MNTPQDEALSNDQVVALAACMMSVAQIDGLRDEEVALIRKFYDGSPNAGLPAFDTLAALDAEGSGLLGKLPKDAGFAERVILMCLMTGFADGHLSADERTKVSAIAAKVGVPATRVDELLVTVKDSLIGSLAHLPDSESVAALAKTL